MVVAIAHVGDVVFPSFGALILPDNTVIEICYYRGSRNAVWMSVCKKETSIVSGWRYSHMGRRSVQTRYDSGRQDYLGRKWRRCMENA